MKIFILVLLCSSICIKLSSQSSYIQVVSEPDVMIFLDGTFKGKTISGINGLIIDNVSSGNHILKIVKQGFNSQEAQINIKLGEVFKYNVERFVPEISISQRGNSEQKKIEIQVGRIKVQSIPVEITISIPSLGNNSFKNKDEWIAYEVPIGNYQATFLWNDKVIPYSINVSSKQLTYLFVNMIKGEIEDRTFNKDAYLNLIFGSLNDTRDGKTYKTINIGGQIWMAENLNFATSLGSWVYGNNQSNASIYGRLYNWSTANKVCPIGWHLPSSSEWDNLINYHGGNEIAGGKMMAINPKEQDSYNIVATNENGFSVLMGGNYARGALGSEGQPFNSLEKEAEFWTSTSDDFTDGKIIRLWYEDRNVTHSTGWKNAYGCSVRCVKDY